jgi:hypothetical protein
VARVLILLLGGILLSNVISGWGRFIVMQTFSLGRELFIFYMGSVLSGNQGANNLFSCCQAGN